MSTSTKAGELDLVGQISAYESGELDVEEIVELFQYLVDTGILFALQGSYQRVAFDLASQGLIELSK